MRVVAPASLAFLACAAALAPPVVEFRPARLTDCWGVARVCVDSFYDRGATIGGVDARLAWAAAFGKRLRAARTGRLAPHTVIVAAAGGEVAGVAEVGLLPAPPGAARSRRAAAPTPDAALWRGVGLDDARAWAAASGDVPTLANVAVATALRRRGTGRALVAAAARACQTDDAWVAWRAAARADAAIYARITEDDAVGFWRGIGFEDVPTADGARDTRGRGGLWLRRDLAAAARTPDAAPPPAPPAPAAAPWWQRSLGS
jgi:ribosomal protein S18 acetylase RimI-like enzyme